MQWIAKTFYLYQSFFVAVFPAPNKQKSEDQLNIVRMKNYKQWILFPFFFKHARFLVLLHLYKAIFSQVEILNIHMVTRFQGKGLWWTTTNCPREGKILNTQNTSIELCAVTSGKGQPSREIFISFSAQSKGNFFNKTTHLKATLPRLLKIFRCLTL